MTYKTSITSFKITKTLFLTLFFVGMFGVLFSQENSISPLFGISNSTNASFENDLNAINQNLGTELKIESFSNTNLLGLNFTVSTQLTSNVDKLFILKNSTDLVVYDLPYFFDPSYSGQKTGVSLSVPVSDIDYHQKNNVIYAYSLANQNLYSIIPFSGALQSNISIPFGGLVQDFALKTTNDFVVLKGMENDSTKLLFHHIADNSNTIIALNTYYKSFYITSHSQMQNLYAVATDSNDINWLLEIDPDYNTVSTISALPSCSNCSTESFLYDANAIALDWENNELIVVLNQSINSNTNYSLLTISLNNGAVKKSVALSKRMSNIYFNKAAADLVFPGDANHDGVVNVRDLFPLGLRYSYNTTPRFSQNIEWIGQHGFNTGVIAQGVDVKHADCNGDGQINSLDIEAIKTNYSSVHNSNKSISVSTSNCDYPLDFSFVENAYEGNDAVVNVKLGEVFEPVSGVYGVAFSIYYDNSFVVQNSMHTVGLNSWFGNDGGNCIHVSHDDFLNGRLDVSLTGVDLLNRAGGGDIIQIAWTMEDDLIPIAVQSSSLNLRIGDVYIINLLEEELQSCGVDTFLQVTRKDAVGIKPVDKDFIKIFPNPAKSQIQIQTTEKIEKIELLNTSGQHIKKMNFRNKSSIDVSTISKGVYLLKIDTEQGSFFEKIVVE